MEKVNNIIAYYHGCQECGQEFYTGEDGYKREGKYICDKCATSKPVVEKKKDIEMGCKKKKKTKTKSKKKTL